MRVRPNYRITLSRERPAARSGRRLALGVALAALAVAGVMALPASGATNGSVSVTLSVVSQAVKSVTVSPGTTSYTNCVYGSSTSTQLGFANGACMGASPITVTDGGSGDVVAVIVVNGADMVPSDSGTHWTLCTIGSNCGSPMEPGANQFYETVSTATGQNSGAQIGSGRFLGLANGTTCDTVLGGTTCAFNNGVSTSEYLAMTGPASSTDTSTSFSTAVTWTAT